ncbi:macro domain-containing protein [Gudongella sp. SC589]|jgi:O-acetyl-ADP-ribose deacetylase (regulator of RNase III)|uniref:macro domain-containing protein n=1 Tax=Gudongella sp. SC589 TaxID=3385990 RepID=UPI003904D5F8
MKFGGIDIIIKKGDITEEKVDGIVNAANNTLLGGGGVDGAIHRKGGQSILEQCKKHSGCPTGEARITTAGNLPCKYVIHAVGPIYGRKDGMEEKLLYNAYYNSLKLADEYGLKSLSFPSISTGAYGYPIKEAVKIVKKALKDFSNRNSSLEEVSLVLFNEDDLKVYENYFNSSL